MDLFSKKYTLQGLEHIIKVNFKVFSLNPLGRNTGYLKVSELWERRKSLENIPLLILILNVCRYVCGYKSCLGDKPFDLTRSTLHFPQRHDKRFTVRGSLLR